MMQPTHRANPTLPSITTPTPDLPHHDPQSQLLGDRGAASTIETPQSQTQQSTSHTPQSRNTEKPKRRSTPSVGYDAPDAYQALDDPAPVLSPHEASLRRLTSREETLSYMRRKSSALASASAREARLLRRATTSSRTNYEVPDEYANLDELAASSPVQNPDEAPIYRFRSLEEARGDERTYQQDRRESLQGERPVKEQEEAAEEEKEQGEERGVQVSRFATRLYTHCYLVLFSILGTLARLGLQTLTEHPGAPVIFGVVWANFGGSLIMGFLSEDRMLFLHEWGTPVYDQELAKAREQDRDQEESGSGTDSRVVDLADAKKAHMATKKTIPLYIGLATGFCGSFTSFSSFIRDLFLAMSNDLASPDVTAPPRRNGGYSFMALISVLLTTVCLSLSALFIGAHLAIALEPMTPSLPYPFTRKVLDRVAVPLSIGVWLSSIVLAISPPHSKWRGDALFALSFAPLGCLARFYASIYLNGQIASFPLGTFVANVTGTAVLGMCWDLAHIPIGGVVGCQVLEGLQDGFCGCLTTVSTWVAELAALRRGHAYIYGGVSVAASLGMLVAIMGGLKWSSGFNSMVC